MKENSEQKLLVYIKKQLRKALEKKQKREWAWYTTCKHCLGWLYSARTDGYCKASGDVTSEYRCSFCGNKAKFEFYPMIQKESMK